MHWIRFLKLPNAITVKGRGCYVSALITVTTDLGESFLMSNCDILVWIEYMHHGRCSSSSKVFYKWKSGARQLAVQCLLDHSKASTICMVVANSNDKSPERSTIDPNTCLSKVFAARAVVSQESCQDGASYTERQLGRLGNLSLSIYEETGESIARHLWDAGVGFVDFIIHRIYSPVSNDSTALPQLTTLLSSVKEKRLHIIELGCGCGLVGIALSSYRENCHVVLTDLPEAQHVARFNMTKNRAARSSQAEFSVLDWDEGVPNHITEISFDLVLITDCTYNPSSAAALVATLKTLATSSPQLLITVAMKIRHPSEAVFFDFMNEAGFEQVEHDVLPLPDAEVSEHSSGKEKVDMYCFRLG